MMTIYTTNNCIWCSRAKSLLFSYNLEFIVVILDTAEKKAEFKSRTGLKTVPQIYDYDNNHIGGYDELVSYLQEKKYG